MLNRRTMRAGFFLGPRGTRIRVVGIMTFADELQLEDGTTTFHLEDGTTPLEGQAA